MTTEIINTGSELMLGRVLNTHQQWLCRRLSDLGYLVSRQVAIPDAGPAIQQAVREAFSRADLVIVTGGLGPTSDDVTRPLIAELVGHRLIEDASIVERITKFFADRRRPMPASTRVQALVPEGAIILDNDNGTAPGLAMLVQPNPFRENGAPTWLVMLPGPPRELQPMFLNQLVPLLRERLPLTGAFHCKTFRTTGLGESLIEEKIAGPLQSLTAAGLGIGYCARFGEVEVRFTSTAMDGARLITEAGTILRGLIGKYIYGEDDESLEAVLVRELTARGETLALAESCTGGFLANRITNVPGASAVLLSGWVTYSNAAKTSSLGVREETLRQHGAVSEPVVREMAEGARARSGANYALAVTGIAGPSGGTAEKPVGTVFIALATKDKTRVLNPVNRYDRESFKFVTSQQALDLLRRILLRVD